MELFFYEIINRTGNDVAIHLSFSSRNITDDLRNRFDQINEFAPYHQGKEDWQWWTAYTTEKIFVPEDLDQNSLFGELDMAMIKVFEFENEIKKKLGL